MADKKPKYRCTIISGFPGIGKSEAANKSRYVIDFESTPYHYKYDYKKGEMIEQENWVQHYVDLIQQESTQEKYAINHLLVSSHAEVRREMTKRGIPYVVVAPNEKLKYEYLKRYLKRGSTVEFIKYMNDNWRDFFSGIAVETAPVVYLDSGEYLSDLIVI